MPPLPVVPQVCKLAIEGTYHDTAWVNIWYVHYTGTAPSESNLTAYLAAISSAVQTNYEAQMSVDNEVTGFKITDLTSDVGAVATQSMSWFGARTGDFVPASVAVCASQTIVRRYRGGHPRKYLPWGTAGTYASGSTKDWDSTFVSDCNSALAAILAGLIGVTEGGTTWDAVVNVSYRSGGAVRATAVIDTVLQMTTRVRICSQRRRLGKVGG